MSNITQLNAVLNSATLYLGRVHMWRVKHPAKDIEADSTLRATQAAFSNFEHAYRKAATFRKIADAALELLMQAEQEERILNEMEAGLGNKLVEHAVDAYTRILSPGIGADNFPIERYRQLANDLSKELFIVQEYFDRGTNVLISKLSYAA